jgi:hypothetical protein
MSRKISKTRAKSTDVTSLGKSMSLAAIASPQIEEAKKLGPK